MMESKPESKGKGRSRRKRKRPGRIETACRWIARRVVECPPGVEVRKREKGDNG